MDVITIGDAMITFNPESTGPLQFVGRFERKVGGAEFNFAIGCSRLGLRAGWISRLGQDEFGRYIRNFARGEGIDTSHVHLLEGYPTSLNFKEIREDGGGRTFYYRHRSPTSAMTPDEVPEDYIRQARVLHVSGVFPAIGGNNYEIIKRAISIAKEHGVLVSFDPNIRLKLWSREEAKEKLSALLPDVDILLTGDDEADILIGEKQPERIIERFASLGISRIVVKRGELGSVGYHDGQLHTAPAVPVTKVVDTVGAGDGFDAGFIYATLQGWNLERSLLCANTVGAMVVGVSGDNEGLPYLEDVMLRLQERTLIER